MKTYCKYCEYQEEIDAFEWKDEKVRFSFRRDICPKCGGEMTSKKSEWNSQEQEELEDDASFDYRQRVETERYNQINRLGYYAY